MSPPYALTHRESDTSGIADGRRLLHCKCGETRTMPSRMTIVACVRCGSSMGPPIPALPPAPSHRALGGAASLTQVMCAVALGFALVWTVRVHETSSYAFGLLAIAVVGVFAGGKAYRGGVGGLIVGGSITAAITIVCTYYADVVLEVLARSGLVLIVSDSDALFVKLIGIASLAATISCACVLPQARRFAAWQRVRLERAYRLCT